MEKLRVLELFAGLGACSKALERLNIPHEIVDAVEIDKYAIQSFNAIHKTDFEPQDITTWDKNIDVDLIMHGSPCQDFSLAGKQAGGDEGSGTRSSLMYETIRIVEKLKPKYVTWENVKNLLSKKHKHNFDAYLETLEQLGYKNYYQVLNAKDYGIPQSRERVFTISIRNDIDKNFHFPEKQPLELRLKDLLDAKVDEKYYLSDTQVNRIKTSTYTSNNRRIQKKDYCDTLCARDWKDPKCVQVDFVSKKYNEFIDEKGYIPNMYNPYNNSEIKDIAPTQSTQCGSTTSSSTVLIRNKSLRETLEQNNIEKDISFIDSYNRNIRKDDLSGTITTRVSDSNNTFIAIKNATKQNCDVYSDESVRRIRNNIIKGDTANTLTANAMQSVNHNNCALIEEDNSCNLRIRKLTPKECWRLMGFDDVDFEKAEKINSNTQLYKQAGNSIVVNVLEAIFKELLSEYILDLDKWSDLD